MEQSQTRWKKFRESSAFPLFVLAGVYFLLHALIFHFFGDDLVYAKTLDSTDLFSLLQGYYGDWTSRIFIAPVYLLLLRMNLWVWRAADSLIILVAALSASRLMGKKLSGRENWILCFLFLTDPFQQMATAGWVTTTAVYLWPLALGLFALIPVRKAYEGETIRPFEYVLYVLALAFACNQEQLSAAMLLMLLFFSFDLIRRRKFRIFVGVETVLAASDALFSLTCPGNHLRMLSETKTWLPAFQHYTFFDKMLLGFTTTADHIVAPPAQILSKLTGRNMVMPNLVFLLLCGLILIAVRHASPLKKAVGTFPFFAALLYPLLRDVFLFLRPNTKIFNTEMMLLSDSTVHSARFLIPVFMEFLILIPFLCSVYFAFQKASSACLLTYLILAAGFASRAVMGFSPTLYASSTRTFLFLYASMFLAAFLLHRLVYSGLGERSRRLLFRLLACAGGLGVLMNAVYIMAYNFRYGR